MESNTVTGKAWVAGDHLYAYQIITQEHWHKPLEPDELGKWVMAGLSPEYEQEGAFAREGYSIIVAGSNFAGGGKSIEHPVVGLMGAGIKAVVAESFSRLQFRNGINRGLPLITCSGIRAKVSTGHQLEIELDSGRVSNLTTGEEAAGAPLPGFVREIAEAGGLIAYAQKAMKNGLL